MYQIGRKTDNLLTYLKRYRLNFILKEEKLILK